MSFLYCFKGISRENRSILKNDLVGLQRGQENDGGDV